MKIRRIRMQLGLEREEFAEQLGMSPITIASWETGTRRPSVPVAWQILHMCRAARVPCTLETLLPDPRGDEI